MRDEHGITAGSAFVVPGRGEEEEMGEVWGSETYKSTLGNTSNSRSRSCGSDGKHSRARALTPAWCCEVAQSHPLKQSHDYHGLILTEM